MLEPDTFKTVCMVEIVDQLKVSAKGPYDFFFFREGLLFFLFLLHKSVSVPFPLQDLLF